MNNKRLSSGFLLTLAAGCSFAYRTNDLLDGLGIHVVSKCYAEAASSVAIEHSALWNGTIYKISSLGCTIEWIAPNSEIGVVHHRSECSLALADQMPLLEKVCSEFFSKDKNAEAFRTLFWGRIEPDTRNGSWELSLRLALAAHKSPEWDAKAGKPKNGHINEFVTANANSAMIYPELREVFERFHSSIQFSRAEKVLVLRADKLPFYEQLKRQGVAATEKLPFDCMAWFSVARGTQK